jgi:exodeoxyribonuclease III
MKVASWNVNSLKARLDHLREWLKAAAPDVVCLQELKGETHSFPFDALQEWGYHAAVNGQKTYNGVAILSRVEPLDVQTDIPDYADTQKRVIAVTLGDVRVVSVYVPNGQTLDSEKYAYKLAWLREFKAWLSEELKTYPRLIVAGDFNVAPADADVHDPILWQGQVLVSPAERTAFQELLGLGLFDAFRQFTQPPKSFTWWDYRMQGFRRNHGLRIDHILGSEALRPRLTACDIDKAPRKLEKPSDHTPIIATWQDA